MADTRNLQRDFLDLLDPDEPQHGCEVLAQYRKERPVDRERGEMDATERTRLPAEIRKSRGADEATAGTIQKIVLDPLDWYIQAIWEKYGPNYCGLDSANSFRLAADDLRYRLSNQQMICIEMIEALETKWVAFQAYIGWNNWVRLEKTGSSLKKTEQRLAAIEPLAEHGEKFKTAQRTKAKRPRSRQKVDGEAFSIKSIIDILAKRKDALGEWVPSMDLWPELFSELDRRELDPSESADRITFTKNDSGDIGEIKKSSFKAMVSRARKNQS